MIIVPWNVKDYVHIRDFFSIKNLLSKKRWDQIFKKDQGDVPYKLYAFNLSKVAEHFANIFFFYLKWGVVRVCYFHF